MGIEPSMPRRFVSSTPVACKFNDEYVFDADCQKIAAINGLPNLSSGFVRFDGVAEVGRINPYVFGLLFGYFFKIDLDFVSGCFVFDGEINHD